jgi:uncharacterized protein
MNKRVILAGGSGFVGSAITEPLRARGYEVVVLSRSSGPGRVQWDGRTVGEWAQVIDGAHAIVNLTGRSVNCRHTRENRREILESRVNSVRALGDAVARAKTPPQVWVQASGIGYYGDAGDRLLDEKSPPGGDFMAEVCVQWESAFEQLPLSSTRQVVLRLGVVLGRDEGALPLLTKMTRLFAGGAAGNGRQVMSWIHIADVVRIILTAIDEPQLTGIFNVTAPHPVTNSEFMRELRRALHRPWSPPVPAPFVRAGAWLMGSTGELALLSYRAVPQRLLDAGFTFEFPTLPEALRDIYGH